MEQKNEKRVISFGLWGDNPMYRHGLMENIILAKKYYPGWNIQVILSFDNRGLWERFKPCGDIMIVRDADSRINEREAHAVNEWIESGLGFHIMRDHKNHKARMLGGMWGLRTAAMPELQSQLDLWTRCSAITGDNKRGPYWKEDMRFLKEVVWPVAKNNHMAHDDKKRVTGKEIPFKVKINGFVGEQYA